MSTSTASPARIEANRKNSLKSRGPKTEAGKAASRGNALKHGLACETIAATAADAREIDRRSKEMARELKAVGTMQVALVGRIALLSVRLNRCAEHETASLAERITRALADFDAQPVPDGDDPTATAQSRVWAGNRALFDPSKEACLARRHEAAAERGMFRALRELRTLQAAETADPTTQAPAARAEPEPPAVASFGEEPIPDAPAAPADFDPKGEPDPAALASFRQALFAKVAAQAREKARIARESISTPEPSSQPVPTPVSPRMNRRQRRAARANRG